MLLYYNQMALNFCSGSGIATIKDDNKNGNKILYVDNDDEDNELYFKRFHEIELKKGSFQLIPDKKKDRNTCITVIGANGVGKSYWIGQYVQIWHKMYPKQKVFLISEKEEDESLNFSYIKRIKVDDTLIDSPLTLDEFREFPGCLVIADDIDSLTNKLQKSIYETVNKILKVGRSYGINIIITLHNYDGLKTKHFLNECNVIVFFAQNWNRQLDYLTSNYMGLSKNEVKRVRQGKSRATIYIKSYPNIILQEKQVFTLGKDI